MSTTRWRGLAGRSRTMIVALTVLVCTAAPSAAFASASVRGCANTVGQSAISGATVSFQGVNGTYGAGSGQSDGTGCTPYIQMPAGQYDIVFSAAHYDTQWYSNATTQASATPVTLADGQQYSYTAALNHKPEVTGKVVDAVTGQPLAGWLVQFYSPTMQSNGVSGYDAYTASDGTYSADFENDVSTGFGPGNYTACTMDVVDSNTYMPNCYNGVSSSQSATQIPVSAYSITSGINFSVMEAGIISGRTYSPTGQADPNTNMTISAYDRAGNLLASTSGYGNGSYSLTAPVGTDYLSFAQPGFATQYYNAKGGLSCSDPLSVSFNGMTANVDAHMTYAPLTACASTGGGGTGGTGGSGSGGGTGGTGGTGHGTPGFPGHQSVAIGSGGAGHLRVTCSSAGPCSGSLQISVGVLNGLAVVARWKHPKRVVIGSATFHLAAGKSSLVTFTLNAAGRRLLRLAHGQLKVTITLNFAIGGKSTLRRSSITLRGHTGRRRRT